MGWLSVGDGAGGNWRHPEEGTSAGVTVWARTLRLIQQGLCPGGQFVKNEGAVYVFNESTPGATATQLSCKPSKVAIGKKSTCTVTVSDPLAHGPVPRGSVTFSSNGGASGHFNHRSCTLKVERGKASAARCAVTFTPSSPVAYTITARYGGDVHHLQGDDRAVVRTARLTTATTVSCTPLSVKVGAMSSCTAAATGVGSRP